jgi:superoxide reductase
MNRRNFLKSSIVATAAVTVAGTGSVFASSSTSGIIYSAQDEGKWLGKKDSHAPIIHIGEKDVHIMTKHGMSKEHYIVRQTLVDASGTVLGSKTFSPTDKPSSTFTLPEEYKGKLTATSFCNLHDLWITEITV